MRTDRRHRVADARTNIGRTIRWHDEEHVGTILAVEVHHGWPVYVVDWPTGTPTWWADTVATEHSSLIIGDR